MKPRWIEVNDRMQQGYRYALVAPAGRGFHPVRPLKRQRPALKSREARWPYWNSDPTQARTAFSSAGLPV